MPHDVQSLKFPIFFSFSLFCIWLNFLLPVCLAEAWQALGGVSWCGVEVNQLWCYDFSKLGQSSGWQPLGQPVKEMGLFQVTFFLKEEAQATLWDDAWVTNIFTQIDAQGSQFVSSCCPLACESWVERDHDERNMVSLVCCTVMKWNNSKCMWFQICLYHSAASLAYPTMGHLQVFRMHNPSDELQLVKTLSAEHCWKGGRFLRRSLVVILCYSEAVTIIKETNGWHGYPEEVLPQHQGPQQP